ncbi:MAG TPA: RHS repeat domain-containing protein [Candidatus Sulfotelmatobacter sp.]|nr:RHS repeat domain-containing protein [Candidatus Sulfotelmatobacter sp.]
MGCTPRDVPRFLKTDRKNQTIQYVYDALCRLTSKSYPDSTAVEYAYDLAGKVQQVSDPTGVYGFAYDNMGRLIGTTTQYSYLPGFNFQNAYTYDAASGKPGKPGDRRDVHQFFPKAKATEMRRSRAVERNQQG